MEVVGAVPARKEYRFSNFSLTSLCFQIVLNVCITAAFFIVYSSDGFYMNSLKTYEQPSVNYTNRYSISATLSDGQVITSTNMFTASQESDLLLSNLYIAQPDYNGDGKPDLFEFQAELSKVASSLQIVSLDVLLGLQVNTTLLRFPATVQTTFQGRNIAIATASGTLRLQQNTWANLSKNDYGSSDPLETANFNVSGTFTFQLQQPAYVIPELSKQVINDNTDSVQIRLQLNLQTYQRLDVFPSPMQQLIWSWCQFLPVALAVFVVGYFTLVFCFEFEILESRVRYHV